MNDNRCCPHDLPPDSCADCRPRPGMVTAPASLASERGPWVAAAYEGACHGCGEDIEPGDEIRADGHGGWEGRCCGGDDENFDVLLAASSFGSAQARAIRAQAPPGTLAEFWEG